VLGQVGHASVLRGQLPDNGRDLVLGVASLAEDVSDGTLVVGILEDIPQGELVPALNGEQGLALGLEARAHRTQIGQGAHVRHETHLGVDLHANRVGQAHERRVFPEPRELAQAVTGHHLSVARDVVRGAGDVLGVVAKLPRNPLQHAALRGLLQCPVKLARVNDGDVVLDLGLEDGARDRGDLAFLGVHEVNELVTLGG
jgi:hypothetical protein